MAGYAGVSTDDQTLDLQRDTPKSAKCRQIYEEHASGKTTLIGKDVLGLRARCNICTDVHKCGVAVLSAAF